MIYENGNYYGARHYDPCIMRFTTMDPMCEKYYHLSPYAYCGNNPVNAVDLNGDTITIDTGKLHSDSNQGLLYLPHDYYNHITGTSYSSSFKGLLKSKWRATYRENLIRKEAEIPLREYYSYSLLNGIATGLLPRLLDANNNPINY
jgi:hypothetical protein